MQGRAYLDRRHTSPGGGGSLGSARVRRAPAELLGSEHDLQRLAPVIQRVCLGRLLE